MIFNARAAFSTLLTAQPDILKEQLFPAVDCPALITDKDHQPVAFVRERLNAIDTPTILALRQAALKLNTPDLKDLGLNLYVLGNHDGDFHGMGATHNFAPSQVHVLHLPQIEVDRLPGNSNYRQAVLRKRSINILDHNLGDFPGVSTDINLSKASLKIDAYQQELQAAYLELEQKYASVVFPDNSHADEYRQFMQDLHELAIKNVALGGGPFVAAILDADKKLICIGSNRVVALSDPLMHGEVSAITRALQITGRYSLAGCTMITTSQTCIGCAETSARVGISRIIYGNTAREIEDNTPFSEGPLNPMFFSESGITEIRLNNASDLRAFKAFMQNGELYLLKESDSK